MAPNYIKETNDFDDNKIDNFIDYYFHHREIKKYSPCPKMYTAYEQYKNNYDNVDKIDKEFSWNTTTKLMQFALIDEKMRNLN